MYCIPTPPKVYPINRSPVSISDISRMETAEGNSEDPDELASPKPADLDLHCFSNIIYQAPRL